MHSNADFIEEKTGLGAPIFSRPEAKVKTQDILPVLLSIIVIIMVAVLEKQSKFMAAVTATMPIGATLALWIVHSANNGDTETMERFGQGLLIGVVPSIGFLVATWLASRAGLRLLPVLLVGYATWGVGLGLILIARKALGI